MDIPPAPATGSPEPGPSTSPLPVRSSEYAIEDDDGDDSDAALGLLNNEKAPRTHRPRSDSVVFDFANRIQFTESVEAKGVAGVPNEPISLVAGVALIVGMQIGSGIFSSPGVVAKETGSVGSALILWMSAGFLSWAGELCRSVGARVKADLSSYRW